MPATRRPRRRSTTRSRRLVWAGVFVLLTLANVAAIPVWGATNRLTGDEPHYLITAESIATDGDLDVRDEYAGRAYESYHHQTLRRQEVALEDGRRHSPHGPGLPLLLVPGYALGGWVGARAQLAVVAALVLVGAGLLAQRFVRKPGWAAPLATLIAGLSAPLWIYSTQVYPELPAAGLLVVLGLVWVSDRDRRSPRAYSFLSGAVVFCLLLLGFKYAPVAFAVAGIALWRMRDDRRAVARFAVILGVALGGQVLLNITVFGGVTPYSTNVVYAENSTAHLLADNSGGLTRTYRLTGLLLDRHFGIARYAPFWVPALAAAGVMLLVPGVRRVWAAIALVVAAHWATATWLALTMRGYWFPGRQLVAVLPLLVPALAFALSRIPLIASVLGGVSVAVGAWMVHALDTAVVGAARNPFWLPMPGFITAGVVFPDHRVVSMQAAGLTAAWLAAGAALAWTMYVRSVPSATRDGGEVSGRLAASLLVGFPARNEEATVSDLVRRARSLSSCFSSVDVIVVDDGSTDETAQRARDAGAVVIPVAEGRTGLGAGVRTILAANGNVGADWVCFMDADGEYAPEDIPHMVGAALEDDLAYVTGNRFERGRPARMPVWRRAGNRMGSLGVSMLAGLRIRDCQSGIRLLSARAAQDAQVGHDYNYAQVLTLDVLRRGDRMGEVPVSYRRREHGRTFVRLPVYLRHVVPAIWQVMAS